MPHALSRSPHRHPPERAWVGRGTKSVWVAEGVEGGNQAGGRIMNFPSSQREDVPWGAPLSGACPASVLEPIPQVEGT